MNERAIEEDARSLHEELWRDRVKLTGTVNCRPIDLLDPSLVIGMHGYAYECRPSLREIGRPAGRTTTAGWLDKQQKLVLVSEEFELPVQRFTGAHELGHIRLHPNRVVHREVPVEGFSFPRDRIEREADSWAAYFLICR